MTTILAAIFFGISLVFVYRSFYGMRIVVENPGSGSTPVTVSDEKAEA
jgi:succinate dehydrogenase/fumarate reductase cytochrome b subunit